MNIRLLNSMVDDEVDVLRSKNGNIGDDDDGVGSVEGITKSEMNNYVKRSDRGMLIEEWTWEGTPRGCNICIGKACLKSPSSTDDGDGNGVRGKYVEKKRDSLREKKLTKTVSFGRIDIVDLQASIRDLTESNNHYNFNNRNSSNGNDNSQYGASLTIIQFVRKLSRIYVVMRYFVKKASRRIFTMLALIFLIRYGTKSKDNPARDIFVSFLSESLRASSPVLKRFFRVVG